MLRPDMYVPSLRWRQGEYQALHKLAESAKSRIVPLVIVPEIEYDFEERRPKATIGEHIAPFSTRYARKWGERPSWVGIHPKIELARVEGKTLPIDYVFDRLRGVGAKAVPLVSLDAPPDIAAAVAKIVDADKRGVGVKVRLECLMKPSFCASFEGLMAAVGVAADETDFIVDLGSPNYSPYEDFADGLIAATARAKDLLSHRSFVVLGSAFPPSLSFQRPGGRLPRHDWGFFTVLREKLRDGRVPNYGDYTIVNPEFTPRDMRRVKSGGKIVYTSQDEWIVRKGGAFRDNPKQMHEHCSFIVASGKFRGAQFSYGDDYIEKCANHQEGPSTLTLWKQVAISHHIMHVLDDLSKLPAAS